MISNCCPVAHAEYNNSTFSLCLSRVLFPIWGACGLVDGTGGVGGWGACGGCVGGKGG